MRLLWVLAVLAVFGSSAEARLKKRRGQFRRFPTQAFRQPNRFYYDGNQFNRRQYPTASFQYQPQPYYYPQHQQAAPQAVASTSHATPGLVSTEPQRPVAVAAPQQNTSQTSNDVSEAPSSNSDSTTLSNLQGKWEIPCFTLPDVANSLHVEVIVSGNSMTYIGRIFEDKNCLKVEEGKTTVATRTFTLGKDSGVVPGAKEIDISDSDGKTAKSILKIDGNKMSFGVENGNSQIRPTELSPLTLIRKK